MNGKVYMNQEGKEGEFMTAKMRPWGLWDGTTNFDAGSHVKSGRREPRPSYLAACTFAQTPIQQLTSARTEPRAAGRQGYTGDGLVDYLC